MNERDRAYEMWMSIIQARAFMVEGGKRERMIAKRMMPRNRDERIALATLLLNMVDYDKKQS